ncbi:MAG: glycosyltransferase family 2 protein [Muribaculaceae bacterium]|nr:glycosyltransferase family 2 protein [Muribaculaceae bacterium]
MKLFTENHPKEKSLISVIVPVFNAETYLAACLDSIISQSYSYLEIIIINDGSTDFSLKIANKYADQDDRIKVFSFENEGLSQARNHGLAVSTGEYVIFVDSDDLLLPGAIENLWKTIVEYDVDIVEGKAIRGKTHGKLPIIKSYKVKLFDPLEAIENILYQKMLLPSAWGKIYKKNLFENLLFEKGILYEDLDLFYRIYERTFKVASIDYPVYFYRDTEGSLINSWKPQRLDVLKVTEKIENHMHENHPDLINAAIDRRLSANFNMFSLCSVHHDHDNVLKCWEIIKKHRKKSLFNPKVRIKNKIGILISYGGRYLFKTVAKRIYRN